MRLTITIAFLALFVSPPTTPAQATPDAKPERIALWNKRAPIGDGKVENNSSGVRIL